MAENKTKPTETDVGEFISRIADGRRRKDCLTLVDMMEKVTKEKPRMWGTSIVGFGSYHYRYESGREGDSCLTGFSPRKQALVIYVMSGFDDHHRLLGKLGKHKTGKGCLYIKQLDEVDLTALRELISLSVGDLKKRYPKT